MRRRKQPGTCWERSFGWGNRPSFPEWRSLQLGRGLKACAAEIEWGAICCGSMWQLFEFDINLVERPTA